MGLKGLSRGTSTSGRFSLMETPAARWIRFIVMPCAIDAAVDMLQGAMTIASIFEDPLEIPAAKSSAAAVKNRCLAPFTEA